MPTITLNKKVFEKLVGKKLPLDKLKDRISMLGTDLEKIEGNDIHVEIFPNRPDMLSEQGFARAFSSFIGVKTGLKKYDVKKSGQKVIIDKSIDKIRPFTACAIIKKLILNDEKIKEIIQIQEKLHITYGRNRKKAAIGIYPLEKIDLPIHYKALDPKEIKFRPLESDRELNGLEILNKHKAGREFAHLLDGLSRFPVFIDSNKKILSMPPIINSHETGKITEKTKDVFIECSGFDYEVLKKCLNIIVTTFADMGGEIYSMELIYPNKKYNSPDLSPEKMKFDLNYINKLLGLNLKENEAKKLLERMGYGYEKGSILVPAYRADILHQVDLAEDLAVAYGYENFEEVIPNVATIGEEDKLEVFKNRIANILIGLGLNETSSYHLIDKLSQTEKMLAKLEIIEIVDPVSLEYNSLRFWMMPSLINILKENKHHEYPQRIFEIGRIFKNNPKKETKIEEAERLCVLSTHQKSDFTEIKQIFDYLMRSLDLKYSVEEVEHPSFIKGRVGRVIIENKKVAYIGEIHPQVISNFDLDMPLVGFELNLTDLFEIFKKINK